MSAAEFLIQLGKLSQEELNLSQDSGADDERLSTSPAKAPKGKQLKRKEVEKNASNLAENINDSLDINQIKPRFDD